MDSVCGVVRAKTPVNLHQVVRHTKLGDNNDPMTVRIAGPDGKLFAVFLLPVDHKSVLSGVMLLEPGATVRGYIVRRKREREHFYEFADFTVTASPFPI